MFCKNCGIELPDDANFCLKCGKPQHSTSSASTTLPIQGRWEYQEFSAALDGREYKTRGFPIDGSIPYTEAIIPITTVVLELVNRLGSQGWEPTEPIEVDRLYRTRRITGIGRSGNFLDSNSYWSPKEVKINFRRWVTVTKDTGTNDLSELAEEVKKIKYQTDCLRKKTPPLKEKDIKHAIELFKKSNPNASNEDIQNMTKMLKNI